MGVSIGLKTTNYLIKIVFLSLLALLMFYGLSYGDCGSKSISADFTTLSLEELMKIEVETVYGVSKFEQKTTEAPSSVSIITASEIKKYGFRTLGDILNSVAGFYVTYDRNYQYIGARGFSPPGDYNTRVLLLVDGHKVNDNIYNTAYIGREFFLDIDLIDRVEIIRGPGSSIYGSNAFLGTINIITKKAKYYKGLELSGEAGSFDTYKQRITLGETFKDTLDVLLSVSFFNSKGQNLYFKEFDNPATNNGRADGVDGERYNSFFGNIKYRDLVLQGAYITREKIIPTAPWGSEFNTNKTKTNDGSGYINLRYNKDLDALSTFMSRLYYNYYHYDGSYIYNRPPFIRTRDLAWGKSWGGEVQYNRRIYSKHLLTTGLEYQDNFLQKQRAFDETPYAQLMNDTRGSYYWAAFIQDHFSVKDNLILNAGVRHDYYKTFHGNTSPRAGIIYNPFEKTTLKLIYGEAFRVPNAYELYYNDGNITQKANPDLDPERIQTYELVIEQYFKNYRFSASGFYYKIRNLISLTTDPSDGLLVFRNIDNVETKGAEFEAEGRWPNGIEAKINYTFQQANDKDTGRLLVNSPKHLIKSSLFVPLIGKKLSTGIEFHYSGRRKTLAGTYAGGAFLTNTTLMSQDIIKGLEVSGTVYNIFDKKYGFPANGEHTQQIIEQDARTFRVKLTYKF